MSRLRHFLPEKTLNLIFKWLAIPIFDYCDIVWGFNIHINKLVKLQKFAARVITFSNWRESSAPLFNRLKWSPLTEGLKFHTVKYMFKVSHRMASDNAINFFERKK
jgi:hypothetical protein